MSEREGRGWIRVADREPVSLRALRASPERHARHLERARAERARVECMCRPAAPPRLVVRTRAGRFHLARWPGTGHDHDPACPFYSAGPAVSGRAGCRGAIEEGEDGITVRLSAALTAPAAQARLRHGVGERGDGAGRRRLGLLALLHLLWETSALNVLDAARSSRRSWSQCHQVLTQTVHTCTVNDAPLSEVMHVPPPYRGPSGVASDDFEHFFSRLSDRSGGARRRGMILGEIKEIAATRYGAMIRIRHLRPALFLTAGLHERLSLSYRLALNAPPPARRIGLYLVEATPQGNLSLIDAAVMLANPAYLPADSMLEVQMAEALIAARRLVLKPLRYRGEVVFPDFVLFDAPTPIYVEVYGVVGRDAYEQRKRQKQRYYRESGIEVIAWEAGDRLPEVRGENRHGCDPAPRTGPGCGWDVPDCESRARTRASVPAGARYRTGSDG